MRIPGVSGSSEGSLPRLQIAASLLCPHMAEKTLVCLPPLLLVQSVSHVRLFATPWTAALQTSLAITNFQSLLKFMSIELVMPSNHLILVIPFSSHLQSYSASGTFIISQFFTLDCQSMGVSASASILPMNIQD